MLRTLFKRLNFKARRMLSFEISNELEECIRKISEEEERPTSELVDELLKTGLEHKMLREAALERWYSLTRREKDVALLILHDLTCIEIAKRLEISRETVRSHTSKILEKFGVHSMDEMRQAIRRAGILKPRKAARRRA